MSENSKIKELQDALRASLDWIDAIPQDVQLPAMPGFDRDWAECLLDGHKIPKITSADVCAYITTGHMADKTRPKWFAGTAVEFVEIYRQQVSQSKLLAADKMREAIVAELPLDEHLAGLRDALAAWEDA